MPDDDDFEKKRSKFITPDFHKAPNRRLAEKKNKSWLANPENEAVDPFEIEELPN